LFVYMYSRRTDSFRILALSHIPLTCVSFSNKVIFGNFFFNIDKSISESV
jgi:hypothetical protein